MSSSEECTPSPLGEPSACDAAMKVARELKEAGHMAFFAGGCVRDRLLGNEPHDFDVATDARPEQVAKIFRRVQSVGESFGVMLVHLLGHTIEVATFRSDGVYSDGRHPDDVTYSDAEHDAQRRDFTINGIFEDPLTGEIIDYVGGQADIEAGIIRAIGDPQARLREDQLRMLRAVRFAARFGYSISEETAEAIRGESGQLEGVSRERIGQELKKMLLHPNRLGAARELQSLELDAVVLSEPHIECELTRLERLAEDVRYSTVLAAWLLDRHPDTAEEWNSITTRWGGALMLSNEEMTGLQGSLEVFQSFLDTWDGLGIAAQKRLAASAWFGDGLALLRAESEASFHEIDRRVVELAQTGLSPEPLVDGNDLIELGMTPGPVFANVLDALYDAQLEGSLTEREEALRMAEALRETLELFVEGQED